MRLFLSVQLSLELAAAMKSAGGPWMTPVKQTLMLKIKAGKLYVNPPLLWIIWSLQEHLNLRPLEPHLVHLM